jgi:acyl-CoA synthetase (AMP-forming)/AMP-acid ligase II
LTALIEPGFYFGKLSNGENSVLTVYQEFCNTVGDYSSNPFLHIPALATKSYASGPVDYSYEVMLSEVKAVAQVYRDAHYGAGHRVGLVLDNRADAIIHFLALNSLGVSIVPINSGFTTAEIHYVIEHSDLLIVVSLPEYIDAIRDASGSIEVVSSVVFSEVVNAPNSDIEKREPSESTEAAILYTSGTTGKPKGCMLSNEYFLEFGHWYASLGGLCTMERGKERLITPLPLVHMNALAVSLMATIVTGGCLIQLDRFHPSTWWQTVRESKATALHYLGVMPAILLNFPDSPKDDLGYQIKFGFGAGSDPKHQARFEKRFGFPLVEGWAMTECGAGGGLHCQNEPRHVGTRCFGRVTDKVEARLIDDGGKDVEQGLPGELLVRARGENSHRGFFSGYYKNGEETKVVWEGGWLHTGDVARQGEDGSYHFVDRKKNVIRRSGENIAAVEVEGVMLQAPQVDNTAVAPVPDEMRGDEVMACVVLKRGCSPSEETAREIFDFCMERLSYYKVPGYIAFQQVLPMTATEKIQRSELKALCNELVDLGECFDLRDMKKRSKRV